MRTETFVGLRPEELSAQAVEVLPARTALSLVNLNIEVAVPINLDISVNVGDLVSISILSIDL